MDNSEFKNRKLYVLAGTLVMLAIKKLEPVVEVTAENATQEAKMDIRFGMTLLEIGTSFQLFAEMEKALDEGILPMEFLDQRKKEILTIVSAVSEGFETAIKRKSNLTPEEIQYLIDKIKKVTH